MHPDAAAQRLARSLRTAPTATPPRTRGAWAFLPPPRGPHAPTSRARAAQLQATRNYWRVSRLPIFLADHDLGRLDHSYDVGPHLQGKAFRGRTRDHGDQLLVANSQTHLGHEPVDHHAGHLPAESVARADHEGFH